MKLQEMASNGPLLVWKFRRGGYSSSNQTSCFNLSFSLTCGLTLSSSMIPGWNLHIPLCLFRQEDFSNLFAMPFCLWICVEHLLCSKHWNAAGERETGVLHLQKRFTNLLLLLQKACLCAQVSVSGWKGRGERSCAVWSLRS